jgi:hypothetical protein
MRKKVFITAIVGLIPFGTLIPTPAGAQVKVQTGNVIYRVPNGWKQVEQKGITILAPGDITEDEKCAVFLLAGQEHKGALKPAFEKLLEGIAGSGEKVLKKTEITPAPVGGAGIECLQCATVIEDASGKKTVRIYYAAHPGKSRLEIAVLIVTSQDVLQRYSSGIETFLKSWTFANAGGGKTASGEVSKSPASSSSPKSGNGKTTIPVPHSGELNGLYFGQRLQNRLNPFSNTFEYAMEKRWYLFLPDGRVHYGVPQGSSTNFDWEGALRTEPKNCGYYRVSGETLRIEWQGGAKPQELAFKKFGNGNLSVGGLIMEPLISPDGLRFAGTFGFQNFVNTSSAAASQAGGVSSERKITFDRNGNFIEEGFVGFTQTSQGSNGQTGSGVTGGSQSGGRGTYRVRNSILELTYSDGRKRQVSFSLPASQAKTDSPEWVMLNGILFLRR